MTGLASDYMSKLLIGGIAIACTWVHVHHGPFRDRITRYVLSIGSTVCVLWLIHLPRVPGLVKTEDEPKPVVVHMMPRSEWADDGLPVVPEPVKAVGF